MVPWKPIGKPKAGSFAFKNPKILPSFPGTNLKPKAWQLPHRRKGPGSRCETHRRRQEAEALKRSQERERGLRLQRDTRQLISELASDFMATSSGEFDPAVTRILERSGEHFAADRAYVLLYDPSLLPPSAAPERELLELQGIQSLCAFPRYQAGQLTGFVGFDAVLARRDWGEDGVLDFGRIVSDLISIAQARSQMQQALVAARAAEARHASGLRLGVLVDQGLAGVAEVDLNGYLTRVNDRYCSILGYPREALLGRHLRDFTFAADWEREEALLARVLAGERTAILEQRFRRPRRAADRGAGCRRPLMWHGGGADRFPHPGHGNHRAQADPGAVARHYRCRP